jgi:hypothetical protein
MRLLTTRFAGERPSLGRAHEAAPGPTRQTIDDGVSSLVSSAASATRSGPAAASRSRSRVTGLPPRACQEREGTS